MPRWKRKSEISAADFSKLSHLCDTTPGMTVYGNRARTSVMLPLEVATKISALSKMSNQTVNTIIVEILEKYVQEKKNDKRK